jgi:hypothetical protein
MRMKCSTELSWGLFVPEENSDENEVLTELSLGPFVPGENSDDCFLQVLLSAILFIASAYDSHQSFVQSSGSCAFIVPFVRSHAVEAVQGKVSQVFL